ncbi:spermine/spermidine synthase family protein [Mycobacterium kansasii]|uniref:Spermine/spermidine synthase family protein n=1 Tax=Mycobacterium kansasii TaxID=1768 RepID=A0A1V3XQQ5_MYCKA|nr:spermine/spermidine synthase family protein [Mycobacterium kansasii]
MTSTQQAPVAASLRWRAVLLAAVAACAACGIVYELALLTLSASLDGGGIVATSLIVAGYIAALGAGALLVKPLLARAAITFITVEVLLGIVGGLSAAALYVTFAFIGGSLWVLALGTALIGGLVGAEVPLLMTLLQSGRVAEATDTGRTLANLTAADYLGALLGGLSWPFVLLPHLGMIRGAAATGIVNLVAAAVVSVFLLRRVVGVRQLVTALGALTAALGLLVTLLAGARGIETTSRQRLYTDPIIAYRHTAYQEIVVTRRGDDLRLYLDGGLQFATVDEYRYSESLVYPALGSGARSVLVLGGGDGLAAASYCASPVCSRSFRSNSTPRSSNWRAPPCAGPTAVRWTTRACTS